MGKSSPSAPAAPDPQATANAQTGSNIQTAIANARLNRVNQQTPWGSISYTQGPVDANGVPTYSSQITLSPQQQALLDQQQSMASTRNQIANNLLNQTGSRLSQPLDLSRLHPIYDQGQSYAGAVNAGQGGAQGQMPQMAPMSSFSPFGNSQQGPSAIGGPGMQQAPAIGQNLLQSLNSAMGSAPGGPQSPASIQQLQALVQNPQVRAMLMQLIGRP